MRAWSFCAASCLCGISTTLAQETAPATEKPEKSEEPVKKESEYRNWFDVSVGHNFVSGKESTFQERHGTPANQTFGGVSDFHYEQDVGKKGLFEVDGRGIFDNHDYSLRLNIQNPDIGYLRGGYQEFRTYYDGSAGYLPLIDRQFTLYNEDFFVDRGEFWLEGGLTLPNRPEFTFRYSHQFREGQKDSTSWGDTSLGLPAGQSRNIVPSFLDIDEERDIFQLDASHTLANTHFGAGLRYEIDQEENSRNIRRSPLQPADRYLTQREDVDTDLFNVHAFQETRFSDEILFTTGYSFTTLDTDIGGSRIYGADYDSIYDPLFARRQQRDEGFFDLAGGSRVDQHVMNLNFMLTPWENFTIVPSLRAELQEQEGLATVQETNVGAPPALASVIESIENTRTRDFVDVSEGLEVRYTGITNWVLYARAELLEGDGSLKEIFSIQARTDLPLLYSTTDRPVLGPIKAEGEVRILYGSGYGIGGRRGWISVSLGGSPWRHGNDEIRYDGTIGLDAGHGLTLMAQSFNVAALPMTGQSGIAYSATKVGGAAVFHVSRPVGIIAGYYAGISGKNTAREHTFSLGIWVTHEPHPAKQPPVH